MEDSRRPGPDEVVYYEDEISITDIVMRLWRRRGWIVLGPGLAVLLALTWVLISSLRTDEAPVVYYIELRGVTDQALRQDQEQLVGSFANRQYPNGAAFSPQDLLLPEVLSEVYAALELDQSMDTLRRAITVEYGSPTSAAVVTKYRQRLDAGNLDSAQIDRINEAFAEELRATTRRGLRIEVDHVQLGITSGTGTRIAAALPQFWSRVFTERFRVFMPVSLPSAGSSTTAFDDLGDENEILVAGSTLREIRRGLQLILEDNRLQSLTTPDGNGAANIERALEEFETLHFFPLYRQIFTELNPVTRSYVRELELKVRELDIQIEDFNAALRDIQRFRSDVSSGAAPSGGESTVLQLDESSLRQIITLASQGELTRYLSDTLNERRELVNERAALMTQLGRTQADSYVASGSDMQAIRQRARAGLAGIASEYQALLQGAREKLRLEQGQLFSPLGEPGVRATPITSRLSLVLVAAFMAGLLLSVTIVLVLPEEPARATPPSRE